jgi:hypothetical protein
MMGHDDMHRKTTRYHPHAHDPMAKTWADDFTNLALNPGYEKSAAPLSKRRNGLYMGVDKSAGSFFGALDPSKVKETVPLLMLFAAGSIAYFMFID